MGNDLILASINPAPPALSNITPKNIAEVLKESNYAFLPEPNFYPTMKHANSIREGLGIRTIFDLISTLVHPIQGHIEARVIGVPNPDLGPALAEALRDTGVKKALVVSGHGSIDQISPEGGTSCWMFSDSDTAIQHFQLQPSDFGLLERPLDTVKARVRGVLEEAATLVDILQGRLLDVDPVLQFVLIHAAALLVTSGVCDTDVSEKLGRKADVIKERGPGGQRWKEGLRRAKWSIESGEAHKILETYVRVTSQL
jgi:anthranilate phosphoribosyltransferase